MNHCSRACEPKVRAAMQRPIAAKKAGRRETDACRRPFRLLKRDLGWSRRAALRSGYIIGPPIERGGNSWYWLPLRYRDALESVGRKRKSVKSTLHAEWDRKFCGDRNPLYQSGLLGRCGGSHLVGALLHGHGRDGDAQPETRGSPSPVRDDLFLELDRNVPDGDRPGCGAVGRGLPPVYRRSAGLGGSISGP